MMVAMLMMTMIVLMIFLMALLIMFGPDDRASERLVMTCD
jgi:hypothetical protein